MIEVFFPINSEVIYCQKNYRYNKNFNLKFNTQKTFKIFNCEINKNLFTELPSHFVSYLNYTSINGFNNQYNQEYKIIINSS